MMLENLIQLYRCLTAQQKKRFLYLQALIIIMSILETVSIALIGPFIGFVLSDDVDSSLLDFLIGFSSIEPDTMVLYLGLFILAVLFASTAVAILTTYLLAMFSAKTGAELSDRLFKYYCDQDLLFHNANNTALITKNLSTETLRMTDTVINPIMQMNAKIVLCLFILGFVFFVNPIVAFTGISLFALAYSAIYFVAKPMLDANGIELTKVIGQRFLSINECFGGIKEVILANKTDFYHKRYTELGGMYSRARGVNHAISLAPRYLVELFTYGAIVFVILYYLWVDPNKLKSFIGLISMYAIASLKLLPALQHIFTSITQVRGNMSSFLYLKDDLEASGITKVRTQTHQLNSFSSLSFEKVCFRYPGKADNAIKNISFKVNRNECIAFVGPSGSGKSTLVNVLLGLLNPTAGKVSINDRINGFDCIDNRDMLIGYVPQNIYLTDNTLLENIAYGVDPEDIELDRVVTAVESANLSDFIESLKLGLATNVGERGVQISGGQMQRIGIARALYNEPAVLVLDEATSALDGSSEKNIIQSINSVLGNKTIIMIAHRLNTVRDCDTIYLMVDGQVVDSGSYKELLENNKVFQEMITNS